MDKKGITPKFTIDEFRDMVSQCNCSARGQSRTFHQLDRQLEWFGDTISIKVPVIHLPVFFYCRVFGLLVVSIPSTSAQ